jgi:hypothetical protein
MVQRVTIVRRALSTATQAALAQALGPAFAVEEGEVADGDVLVGPPLGQAALTGLRARHQGVTVVAIVRGPGASPAVVDALSAGADACVVEPTAVELAAHLLALCRRAG